MDTEKKSITLTVSLKYLCRNPKFEDEKPYRLINVEPTLKIPITNMEFDMASDVPIRDLRDINHRLSLKNDAMKLYMWPFDIPSLTCKEDIQNIKKYNIEMAEHVKEELGAERVFVYDYRFRNSSTKPPIVSGMHKKPVERGTEPPIPIVHLDHTKEGGWLRIRRHLCKNESSQYLSGAYRVRVINVWRHLNATAFPDMPLGLCLPRSVAPGDLTEMDTVTSDKVGESYYVHYNRRHQWYWASSMVPEEVLAFTTWDSKQPSEQATNCCVHAALQCPWTATAPRESLEIRVIVINAQ